MMYHSLFLLSEEEEISIDRKNKHSHAFVIHKPLLLLQPKEHILKETFVNFEQFCTYFQSHDNAHSS
jgi:hypothetical protein